MEAWGCGKSGIVHSELPDYVEEEFTCVTCGETKMVIERHHKPIVHKVRKEINGCTYLETEVNFRCTKCAKRCEDRKERKRNGKQK